MKIAMVLSPRSVPKASSTPMRRMGGQKNAIIKSQLGSVTRQ
jgi:hypothetical protein